ncbi:coenzyme F420-0:L-glutamate ligase [Proteinivorax hydrogeniformans]|uniref:Coenzyme F420-0:L-glutamate ligase n=1 Tax=Proteinivorax hydrogeniformans TaxID=1826727 RepID=A0AAU8HSP3_9FIRM
MSEKTALMLGDEQDIFRKKDIDVADVAFERYAIKTHFITRGEDYIDIVNHYASPLYKNGDTVFIAEKIIAICQDNVIDKDDMKVGFWAKFLSKFVMKTPAGYSVGNEYKMQAAIQLAGLPRILFAAILSAIGKIFGIRGIFYKVAGNNIAGLDGFYGEAFDEYSHIGILNPIKPEKVCQEIEDKLGIANAIVDANDLGIEILGRSDGVHYSNEQMEKMLRDNPAGQEDEQTPLILYRPKKETTTQ